MNNEQIRKAIVYEVMKEFREGNMLLHQTSIRYIRKVLNSKITKVLNEVK